MYNKCEKTFEILRSEITFVMDLYIHIIITVAFSVALYHVEWISSYHRITRDHPEYKVIQYVDG